MDGITRVKEEDLPVDSAPAESYIPNGFDPYEWNELTDGFFTREEEISYVLSLRGKSQSKGRPTNFKAPYKGEFSNSDRAIAQRARSALLSEEGKAIEAANAADRSAKSNLRKKLDKSATYAALSVAEQEKEFEKEWEKLAASRFDFQKSAEWLEVQLRAAHKKWDNIDLQIGLKKHAATLQSLNNSAQQTSTQQEGSRATQRVFGAGGVLEKIMRKEYNDGLLKLTTNSFESPAAKKEWEDWRDGLSSDELALVASTTWQQIEPPSIYEAFDPDTKLYSSKPFKAGDNDDECEEELDEDSEIEDYYNSVPNEYEESDQGEEAEGESEGESEEDAEGDPDDLDDDDAMEIDHE